MPPFPMSKVPAPPKVVAEGPVKGPKHAKYQHPPSSEFALRLHALYGRRPETRWTNEEAALFLQIKPMYDPADMTALEGYYRAERAKGDSDKGGRHRRDLTTFLRNFAGEVDRARAHQAASQKKVNRYEPKPSNIVPLPIQDEEALRQKGVAAMRATRAAL